MREIRFSKRPPSTLKKLMDRKTDAQDRLRREERGETPRGVLSPLQMVFGIADRDQKVRHIAEFLITAEPDEAKAAVECLLDLIAMDLTRHHWLQDSIGHALPRTTMDVREAIEEPLLEYGFFQSDASLKNSNKGKHITKGVFFSVLTLLAEIAAFKYSSYGLAALGLIPLAVSSYLFVKSRGLIPTYGLSKMPNPVTNNVESASPSLSVRDDC